MIKEGNLQKNIWNKDGKNKVIIVDLKVLQIRVDLQ